MTEHLKFSDIIAQCFHKSFVFKGRASRRAFWTFTFFYQAVLFTSLSFHVISRIILVVHEYSPFVFHAIILSKLCMFLTLTICFVPWVSLNVRRLHDVNKSGFWALLHFTVIGSFLLIFWQLEKGPQDAPACEKNLSMENTYAWDRSIPVRWIMACGIFILSMCFLCFDALLKEAIDRYVYEFYHIPLIIKKEYNI